ncbi:MAG: hypothetical protein HS108_13130 [Planctomycetes bacterium]|nr:hypothetical protein [Planctomycetota bacterium]
MLALILLAACNQPPKSNGEIDIKPDIWRPSEAQSDFLDIGKQAGIEWLSFVPNDQNEYPDFYTGLDSDQKRRLRVAPLETPDERVLIEFKLPQGSKLWPVDWYGTELMAIELPGTKNISLAIARSDNPQGAVVGEIARQFVNKHTGRAVDNGSGGPWDKKNDVGEVVIRDNIAVVMSPIETFAHVAYGEQTLSGRAVAFRIVVEVLEGGDPAKLRAAAKQILSSISIKRELALEGLPKHKCSSSLDELKQGKLVFPGGTLNLPLNQGHIARKAGGDSTIQIDGEGAKPWLLIRRLKPDASDLRIRVRNDATFSRRISRNPDGFGAGRKPQGATLQAVVWDFKETAAEQQLVGVIAVGTELLTIEVISQGLRDGDARRAARDKALALIAAATGTEVPGEPLERLEGWNVGTMGR